MSRSFAASALCALAVAACAEQARVPVADAAIEAGAADAGAAADSANDGAPDAARAADAAPAWPDGFALAPRHVPDGLLCAIPEGYLAQGGDPLHPPCAIELDHLAPAVAAAPAELRVVTWNVQYGARAAAVQLAFAQRPELRQADVILLQEVPRRDGKSDPPGLNLARELAQALRRDYAFAVEWDRHEVAAGGEHGLATLSRFPIGAARLLRHTPAWPGSYYAERKEYGGRATLVVELLVGARVLRAYNAHLENRDATGGGRAQQAAEIEADAAQPGASALQLLGGDLNTFLCNPALVDCAAGPLAEQTIKDLRAAGWIDLLPGYDSWTMLGVNLLPMRLDWIFGRGLTPASHAVLKAVDASDHVPVVATARLP